MNSKITLSLPTILKTFRYAKLELQYLSINWRWCLFVNKYVNKQVYSAIEREMGYNGLGR